MQIWFDTKIVYCLGGCSFYKPFTQAWKAFVLKDNLQGSCGYCKRLQIDMNEYYEHEKLFNFKPGYQLILKDENII